MFEAKHNKGTMKYTSSKSLKTTQTIFDVGLLAGETIIPGMVVTATYQKIAERTESKAWRFIGAGIAGIATFAVIEGTRRVIKSSYNVKIQKALELENGGFLTTSVTPDGVMTSNSASAYPGPYQYGYGYTATTPYPYTQTMVPVTSPDVQQILRDVDKVNERMGYGSSIVDPNYG